MKIKIDGAVKTYAGKPFQVTNEDNIKRDITFRDMIETACSTELQAHPLTAEKKQFAYQIGIKCLAGKKRSEYDLTTDQIAFLKERIGLMYVTPMYGRFLELIGDLKVDPDPVEPEK